MVPLCFRQSYMLSSRQFCSHSIFDILAAINNAGDPSAGDSPQSITEKLDDPHTAPSNVAMVCRTNGNGNTRRRKENEEDGEDDDNEEEEERSPKYERMGGAINGLLKKVSVSSALAGFQQVFGTSVVEYQLVHWTSKLWS